MGGVLGQRTSLPAPSSGKYKKNWVYPCPWPRLRNSRQERKLHISHRGLCRGSWSLPAHKTRSGKGRRLKLVQDFETLLATRQTIHTKKKSKWSLCWGRRVTHVFETLRKADNLLIFSQGPLCGTNNIYTLSKRYMCSTNHLALFPIFSLCSAHHLCVCCRFFGRDVAVKQDTSTRTYRTVQWLCRAAQTDLRFM